MTPTPSKSASERAALVKEARNRAYMSRQFALVPWFPPTADEYDPYSG